MVKLHQHMMSLLAQTAENLILFSDRCSLVVATDIIWKSCSDYKKETLICYGQIAPTSPYTQDVNWTYIRRSEDEQDICWTSYVRSIYVLCLRGYGTKYSRVD